jgi:hypothetical protein
VEYLCQLKMFIMFVNLTTLDADMTGGVSFWWSIFLRGLFRKDVCPLQDDFLADRRDFALPGHLVTPPQLTNSPRGIGRVTGYPDDALVPRRGRLR